MEKIEVTLYIAEDGREFRDKDACAAYELEAEFENIIEDERYLDPDAGTYCISEIADFIRFFTENEAFVEKICKHLNEKQPEIRVGTAD